MKPLGGQIVNKNISLEDTDAAWLTNFLQNQLGRIGDVEHLRRCRRMLLAMGVRPRMTHNAYELVLLRRKTEKVVLAAAPAQPPLPAAEAELAS
jgi:hypothetical protein